MKKWHLLNQKIADWRNKASLNNNKQSVLQSKQKKSFLKRNQSKPHKSQRDNPEISWYDSIVMLSLAIILLTGVVGYRFYNQPQLTVGKISPVTIKSPSQGSFEDIKTTIEKRKEVQTGITPILEQNERVTAEISLELYNYLEEIEDLRNLTTPFPYIDKSIISLATQQYLRSCSEDEIRNIYDLLEPLQQGEIQQATKFGLPMQKALTEMRALRQKLTTQDYQAILAKLKIARYRYGQGSTQVKQQQIGDFTPEEMVVILSANQATWTKAKASLNEISEKILTQGIAPGTPENILEKTIALHFGKILPEDVSLWSKKLLLLVLRPNLQEDKNATLSIAEKAAEEIEPVKVHIEKGVTIVEEGEIISQADFVLLDGLDLSRRGINWKGLLISTGIVTLAIAIFLICQKQTYTSLRYRDYLLLCLLTLSAPLLTIFQVPYLNLPAIGLLVSSFYNPLISVCQMFLVTGLNFFSHPSIGWEYLLAGGAGGLMASAVAGRLRSREAISKLGVIVGLVQGSVYFITTLIASASAITIWSAVLPDAIVYGLSGVAWFIVALGISPYLERFFDLITPIRLAELSNPNLPLLKRLATEAPGTFQHTMFVASLAESAARALNCNVELVRAGTLYHDIGKMHDPLGFIENQMGNPNKHDQINDPWQSAEIIKKHVSEGLVMAKKYGLPKAIRDFIPEHQGTLLIAYFYHQARQIEDNSNHLKALEEDFRYAGPVPQSREAGIMMLADGCEAALRSLKDATPEKALATVKKIFKARWQDKQLSDSGLRYDELPIVADVFIQVWQQFNHKRIVYPKGSLDTK